MRSLMILVLGACLLAPAANAQESNGTVSSWEDLPSRQKMTNLLEGKLDKKEARQLLDPLAQTIALNAHPSGRSPDLLNFRLSFLSPGVAQLVMGVEYFGALTGKRYPATIYVTFDVGDQQAPAVTRLGFVDAVNRIPPNTQNLSLLRRKLNQVLAE